MKSFFKYIEAIHKYITISVYVVLALPFVYGMLSFFADCEFVSAIRNFIIIVVLSIVINLIVKNFLFPSFVLLVILWIFSLYFYLQNLSGIKRHREQLFGDNCFLCDSYWVYVIYGFTFLFTVMNRIVSNKRRGCAK